MVKKFLTRLLTVNERLRHAPPPPPAPPCPPSSSRAPLRVPAAPAAPGGGPRACGSAWECQSLGARWTVVRLQARVSRALATGP